MREDRLANDKFQLQDPITDIEASVGQSVQRSILSKMYPEVLNDKRQRTLRIQSSRKLYLIMAAVEFCWCIRLSCKAVEVTKGRSCHLPWSRDSMLETHVQWRHQADPDMY